jgi:hypothetical protein
VRKRFALIAVEICRVRLRGAVVIQRLNPARPTASPATLADVTEVAQSLDQRLEEIGAQLAWVRDYL